MYKNMNNRVARDIKIFGNILGVYGVITGFYTLIVNADMSEGVIVDEVYEAVSGWQLIFTSLEVMSGYLIVMFIFWALAEIIELLSVIKANTTNQVEISCQMYTDSTANTSGATTDDSENL